MKKFFTIFFVVLGVIFSIIILGLIYLYVADPFNIKPIIFGTTINTAIPTPSPNSTKTPKTTQTNLSDPQKKALESVGINPSTLPSPSTITPVQEACFVGKLGSARVAEIKAGAVPTAVEIFTSKVCI